MKRIMILCILMLFSVSSLANAEVSKGKDSFSEDLYVTSLEAIYPHFNSIQFIKKFSKHLTTYEFSVSCIQMKDAVFGNAPIEIKIDNEPVQELSDYRYKLTGPDSYGVNYNSVIDVKFPVELAEKIKNAEKVTIRYQDIMETKYPYVLKESMLAEWKQVINTTEWDILQDIEAQKKRDK